MGNTAIKDKHFRLDQRKIDRVREILGAKNETEAIEMALDILIGTDTSQKKRTETADRILNRRAELRPIHEDVSNWVEVGREERDRPYGG